MVVVADASVAIRGDLSGFESDLRRAEGSSASTAGKINLTFANILKAGALFGVGTSLHSLVQGTVRELGDAAAAYAQLQQTQRTTDEVFGESARVIEDWAERAAAAAGMSKTVVFQSGAVMGQTLRNMGFDAEEAAEKTVILQQRAAELAVAFGQTPERAILAILAAMRGERDTIEKFGVSIKQVDVNSRVAAMGLDTSTAAAKKNAEAIAILDLVMEQTAAQAGRFGESQDDVAVKLLQTQALIDNAMLEVGQNVASIQLGAVRVGTFAGEELDKFAMHFGDRMQTINQLAQENGTTWDEMQDKIITTMQESGKSFEEVTDGMSRDAQLARAAIGMEMPLAMQEMQDAIKLGGPVVAAEMGKVAGMLPSEIRAQIDEIKAAGEDIMGPDGLAGGILAAQQKPLDAIDELLRVLEESLSPAEQIASLTGERAVNALAEALNSPLLVDRLAGSAALASVIEQLNALGPAGYAAGVALMNQLGYAIDNNAGTPTQAARRAAGMVRGVFPFSEPKDPQSPFRGITEWGGNIVRTIAEGMYNELGTGAAASRALAGALVPSLGVPAWANGTPATPGTAMGLGQTIQYILSVEGQPVMVGSAEDVLARWAQVTSLSKEGVQ